MSTTNGTVRRNRINMQRLRAQTLEIAEDLTLGLMSAERDEKVRRLVDHMLDKGVKLKEVKGSDSLAAAKLYVDRRWPTRQESSAPSYSFIQVNLCEATPDAALDITPTTTGCVDDPSRFTVSGFLNDSEKSNVS
jgi:hypothetical protein